jgi:hypothetical protein
MREPRAFPVHASGRADGADLQVHAAHYEHVIKDLIGVLDENPDLLGDLLALFADKPPVQDPHDIAQPDPVDLLAERLVAALPVASRTIRLHHNPLARLADNLTSLAGRRTGWFPRQQNRRAA